MLHHKKGDRMTSTLDAVVSACAGNKPVKDIVGAIETAVQEVAETLLVSAHEPDDFHEIRQTLLQVFQEIVEELLDELEENTYARNRMVAACESLSKEILVDDILEDWKDSALRNRDPYSYYGIRPSDFF